MRCEKRLNPSFFIGGYMESYQSKKIGREVYLIKKFYCNKCIHYKQYKCTLNKVYSNCLKNNERSIE